MAQTTIFTRDYNGHRLMLLHFGEAIAITIGLDEPYFKFSYWHNILFEVNKSLSIAKLTKLCNTISNL